MENEFFGFQYQGTGGQCGVYSLCHALNFAGIPNEFNKTQMRCRYVSITESIKKHYKSFSIQKIRDAVGTESNGIIAGIKKTGCDIIENDDYEETKAKENLDKNISNGYPVILWVNWTGEADDDGHWFVCGGKCKDKFVIIDSEPYENDTEIFSLYTWKQLVDRCLWYDDDTEEYNFELYSIAIKPENSLSCVKQMDFFFPKLSRDENFQEWWGYYLNDLLDVCDKETECSGSFIQFSDVLKERYYTIIELICYWLDEIDKKDLEYELDNYILVSEAYKFIVLENKKENALISFTAALIGGMLY